MADEVLLLLAEVKRLKRENEELNKRIEELEFTCNTILEMNE
jgi:ubiquinone biosynthesis protein UbiJ